MSNQQNHKFHLTRRVAFWCSLISIVILLILTMFIYVCTDVQTLTAEEFEMIALYSEFQEKMGILEKNEANKIVFNDIYVVEFSNLFGKKQTVVSCPYSVNNVGAILLAGTTHWRLGLDTLTLVWQDGIFVGDGNSKILSPELVVNADPNTWLNMSGNSVLYSSDALYKEHEKAQNTYWVDIRASTLDSDIDRNATCMLNICWEGKLAIKAGILMPWTQKVEVSAAIAYQNNWRS